MGVGGKSVNGVGWGGWWQWLKQRSGMIKLARFRVAMASTCSIDVHHRNQPNKSKLALYTYYYINCKSH